MHIDLTDLRLLLAITDAGSLSKAAERFPIALSAASNRLPGFEDECGDRRRDLAAVSHRPPGAAGARRPPLAARPTTRMRHAVEFSFVCLPAERPMQHFIEARAWRLPAVLRASWRSAS